MTDIVLVLNEQSLIADTVESFYTAPVSGEGTIIKSFTATNDTGVNRSYKAYIFGPTGTPDAVVPFKVVIRNRFDSAPGLIGQVIPAGGSLRMESSLTNSISWYVTGKEQ